MNGEPQPHVFISTGHTGGHFFPALCFADALQEENPNIRIHFLLNRKPACPESYMGGRSYQLHINLYSLPSTVSPLSFLLFLIRFLLASVRIYWFFVVYRPKLVVGFGSYSSVPSVVLAALFGARVLIHEQNVKGGKANEFLSPWADRVALSFPEALTSFPTEKVVYSGYPLRPSFRREPARRADRIDAVERKPFTILAFGGSQGAEIVNEIFLDAVTSLLPEEKLDLAVIHIVGNNRVERFEAAYRQHGIRARVLCFTDQIARELSDADLVIARAGAGTIFELAAFGRPAILIPYPHAGAHQELNADYLRRNGYAFIIPQSELTVASLRNAVRLLRDSPTRRNELGNRIQQLANSNSHAFLVKMSKELLWK